MMMDETETSQGNHRHADLNLSNKFVLVLAAPREDIYNHLTKITWQWRDFLKPRTWTTNKPFVGKVSKQNFRIRINSKNSNVPMPPLAGSMTDFGKDDQTKLIVKADFVRNFLSVWALFISFPIILALIVNLVRGMEDTSFVLNIFCGFLSIFCLVAGLLLYLFMTFELEATKQQLVEELQNLGATIAVYNLDDSSAP